MDIKKINTFVGLFLKKAQLGLGQSTLTFQGAIEIANQVKNGLSKIQPVLLNQYPHQNLELVVEMLLDGELPDDNLRNQAIMEFYSGLNAFAPLAGIDFKSIKYIS